MSSRRGREQLVRMRIAKEEEEEKKKCRSERTSPLITLSLHNRQGESTRIIKLMVWLFACCCGSVFFFFLKCIYCFLFLSPSSFIAFSSPANGLIGVTIKQQPN